MKINIYGALQIESLDTGDYAERLFANTNDRNAYKREDPGIDVFSAERGYLRACRSVIACKNFLMGNRTMRKYLRTRAEDACAEVSAVNKLRMFMKIRTFVNRIKEMKI